MTYEVKAIPYTPSDVALAMDEGWEPFSSTIVETMLYPSNPGSSGITVTYTPQAVKYTYLLLRRAVRAPRKPPRYEG